MVEKGPMVIKHRERETILTEAVANHGTHRC